jgi:bifunctional non-homologous end joining protein LigD
MVLLRHPDGIKGNSFFQKNVDPRGLPPYVQQVTVRAGSTGRNVHYVVCNNISALLYLANLGCIELHPWNTRRARLEHPDFMVIDLDPANAPFRDVVTVARVVRQVVEKAGGRCLLKTSGKTGLHICIPLAGKPERAEMRQAAKLICRIVNQRLPKLTRFARRATARERRVYLDYSRNGLGQTIVAPYALRAAPLAPVSTPLEWAELTAGLRPTRYTMRTIFRRLAAKGDIWKGKFRNGVNINRFLAHLQHLLTESAIDTH